MAEENKNIYQMKDCLCKHCSFEGDVELQKGTKLEDSNCPSCGNQGLYRRPQTTSYHNFDN